MMTRITVWEDPLTVINSQYGEISWAKWLGCEQERLTVAGIKSQIKKREKDHFVAIFREVKNTSGD